MTPKKVSQELRPGDSVFLDHEGIGRIQVTLEKKAGQRARLAIWVGDDWKVTPHLIDAAQVIAKSGLTVGRR
jgi:hypothetical protein